MLKGLGGEKAMVRNVRKPVRLRSMETTNWGDATWTELAALGLGGSAEGDGTEQGDPAARVEASRARVIALLPVGAVEAHGPHLAVSTDVTIAEAAAEAALSGLATMGFSGKVLPSLAYTPASFAAGFPGTISVRPATIRALIEDIADSLERQGVHALVIVNAHLDPGHLGALHEFAAARTGAREQSSRSLPVVFPDISRKPWALRMTQEFKSGACHAGQYETSVVLAARPQDVRQDRMAGLADNPSSLSDAIRKGAATFEDAGVDRAYCGSPAQATADEGENTIRTLGDIVTDAVREALLGESTT